MEPESNNGMAIFIGILIFASGVGGAFWYFFYSEGRSPFSPTITQTMQSTAQASGGGHRIPGDVNDDGIINSTDSEIVREHVGCSSTDACWGKVIGKTLSGDNPIYTSDLDFNTDDTIDENDVFFVQNKFVK